MLNNLRKLGILLAFLVILLVGVLALAVSYIDIGLAEMVLEEEDVLPVLDLSQVPQSVIEDASSLARELYGDYQDEYNSFVYQLLNTYVEVKEKDCLLIFNPGGWGSTLLETSSAWYDISLGIRAELDELGYSSMVVDYRRTSKSIRGAMNEFVEIFREYPTKANNLASRVDFLTRNVPELKIIVAGESNGSVISDRVMAIMVNNPRVYSIQTGPPPWHRQNTLERTLLLNDNGVTPDSFARGDVAAVLWASIKALFGFSDPEEEDPGRILYFMRAPGHDYRWQHPTVYSEITQFLKQNFGLKVAHIQPDY
jgi:hypothetical protein